MKGHLRRLRCSKSPERQTTGRAKEVVGSGIAEIAIATPDPKSPPAKLTVREVTPDKSKTDASFELGATATSFPVAPS
jgi:hypothetical protein